MKKIITLLVFCVLASCTNQINPTSNPEAYALQMLADFGGKVEQGIDKPVKIASVGTKQEMRINYGENLTYTTIYKLQNNYKKDRIAEQMDSDTKVIKYVMEMKNITIRFQKTGCNKEKMMCYLISVMDNPNENIDKAVSNL